MRILLTAIRKNGGDAGLSRLLSSAVLHYVERIQKYTDAESVSYPTEGAFFTAVEKLRARTAPVVVLLDSRGKALSSQELAGWIEKQRDGGTRNLIFAIGPAYGWSEAAKKQAGLLLSFGPITLPHELARVVVAEQVYRAFTILAGHPYHAGH
jgi:23S rRNA (pseudouridine1915-N3)-methyltransferase